MTKLVYRLEHFREGDLWVARCPDLDLSSFGDTPEDGRHALQEAVEAFMEGCEMLGTLEDVLEDSGFVRARETWRVRDRISEEIDTILPSGFPEEELPRSLTVFSPESFS